MAGRQKVKRGAILPESDRGFIPPAPFTLDESDERGLLLGRVYTKEESLKYLEHGRTICRFTIASLTEEQANQRCINTRAAARLNSRRFRSAESRAVSGIWTEHPVRKTRDNLR